MPAKILIGDVVVVTTGDAKGQSGEVIRFAGDRVVLEGVNERVRNAKARGGQPGGRSTFYAPISLSNVALLDPKTKKPSRVGFKDEGGKLVRVLRKTGTVLEGVSKVAPATVKKTKKADKSNE